MSTVKGNGREYDLSLKPAAELKTTTSQYLVVGMPNTTTAVDRTAYLSGQTAAGTVMTPTATAFFAIGINQSYLSAGSEVCQVRVFGESKAICAETINAGAAVMAYWGVSTTTMAGRIVMVDDGVSISAATASVSAECVILGRALESGVTGTVISVMLQPQLYDLSLVGSISIT